MGGGNHGLQTRATLRDTSHQKLFERTAAGVELLGELLAHVEALALDAGDAKDGRVERIDRALAVQLGELAGLEGAVAVAQKHHRPVGAVGVLLVGVVAGVDDERVVHHRAAALGHAFQLFHELHQHAAVVLADLDPDRIVRLVHVPEVVPLLLDAQTFPGTKDFAAAGADGEDAGDARLEGRDAQVQEDVVPVGLEFGIGVALVHFGREIRR